MEKITDSILYVGVNDHDIDLFEGQYDVPRGMAYNSYVILDEKVAIMDSVDQHFGDEWLNKVKEALNGRKPDYLVVQHMEPDHSANIMKLLEVYPDTTIVGNVKTFVMMKNFFGTEPAHKLVVKENDVLDLGTHHLKFVFAPMVHWPEVMMTYESSEKVMFTADAFGKFGANDIVDPEGWDCEARRYYFGIVGKYGMQVQALFKKLAGLQIEKILALHGPFLTENLDHYLSQYNIWSSYGVESQGVFIAYTSVYGHTKVAALELQKELEALNVHVAIADLAREDLHEAVEDAFRYGKVVLATTTYNMSIFPKMNNFIDELLERNYQSRTIGIIENGSWAPMAAKVIKEKFASSKNITFVEPVVKVMSAMNDDNKAQIKALAAELAK